MRCGDGAATAFPAAWPSIRCCVGAAIPVTTTDPSCTFTSSVRVTVSPGVTSYNVILAPSCLGRPTTLRGPSSLRESPALRAVIFPLRTIGGRTGWTPAYPEAGKTFSALSVAADTAGAAAALLSVARMLGCEEGGAAFPKSAICGILPTNPCLESAGSWVVALFAVALSVATLFRCRRPAATDV